MQDLTTGSVSRHLLKTSGFMLVTMVFQTMYFLVDLYWVGRLGTQAVAAVGIAGNLTFIVMALSQMLGVGTTALVAHAAGFEFLMMSVYLLIVYSVTRPFGAAAQAGFGIGMRVVQAGFMPVVALGFSVAPVAGQNFGAGHPERVKRTFRDAALMASGAMLIFGIACQIAPAAMVSVFSKDPAVIAVGVEYLQIISWNFIASGLIFVASSMFQAMGNTIPSLVTSGMRILIVAVPVLLLAKSSGFALHWIWYLSVVSVFVQLIVSMLLLRREFSRRLVFGVPGTG